MGKKIVMQINLTQREKKVLETILNDVCTSFNTSKQKDSPAHLVVANLYLKLIAG